MLDNFGIAFSCIAILMVIVAAARLDKSMPWYEMPPRDKSPPEPVSAPASASARRAADEIPVWRRRR